MNAPADSPRTIIAEWLRNSAICLALIVVGLVIADLIADAIGRDVPGSYPFGLMIGWYPAAWFIIRYQKARIRWWEYVGGAVAFVALDVLCDWLQLNVLMRGYIVGPAWLLLIQLYQRFRPKFDSTPSANS